MNTSATIFAVTLLACLAPGLEANAQTMEQAPKMPNPFSKGAPPPRKDAAGSGAATTGTGSSSFTPATRGPVASESAAQSKITIGNQRKTTTSIGAPGGTAVQPTTSSGDQGPAGAADTTASPALQKGRGRSGGVGAAGAGAAAGATTASANSAFRAKLTQDYGADSVALVDKAIAFAQRDLQRLDATYSNGFAKPGTALAKNDVSVKEKQHYLTLVSKIDLGDTDSLARAAAQFAVSSVAVSKDDPMFTYLGPEVYLGYVLDARDRATALPSPEKICKSTSERSKLTDIEKAAVFGYTTFDYEALNTALRNNATTAQMNAYIQHAKDGIAKAPLCDPSAPNGLVTTSRTVTFDEKDSWVPKVYKDGDIVTEKAFLSTSATRASAADLAAKPVGNGQNLFLITGVAHDIMPYSAHPAEQEVLYASGSRFKVETDKTNPGVIHLYEVLGASGSAATAQSQEDTPAATNTAAAQVPVRAAPDPTLPGPCDPAVSPKLQSKVSTQRQAAFKACLTEVAKPIEQDPNLVKYVKNGVTKLFTYGTDAKIQGIAALHPDQVLLFQETLQQRREERRATSNGYSNLPDEVRSKVLADAQVLARNNYDLTDLLNAYRADQTKTTGGRVSAYQLAGYVKIYPKLFDDIESNFGDQGAELTDTQRDALALADTLPPAFDSTAGNGMYFAVDPDQSLSHGGAAGQGSGLACLVRGAKVVDIDDASVASTLTKAGIYRGPDKSIQGKEGSIVNPSGKNIWVSPRDVEMAAKGLLVAFRAGSNSNVLNAPYIVDKGAVDYRQCQSYGVKDKFVPAQANTQDNQRTQDQAVGTQAVGTVANGGQASGPPTAVTETPAIQANGNQGGGAQSIRLGLKRALANKLKQSGEAGQQP